MKNWKTTLFGVLFGVPTLLHSMGINLGHIGSADFLTLIQAATATALGYCAKDNNVTGGEVKQ
jgi:hypothetical protein